MHPHFARHVSRLLHAAGRHRGFSGFGFGGHGDDFDVVFGRGRKLGSGQLQLLLLALLAERPSHGYELIQALEERSRGYYSPSPGMVYPALTYLEETSLARVETEGTRKRYTITEQGLAHLEKHRTEVDALLEQLAWIGTRVEALRGAVTGQAGAEGDFDDPHAFRGKGRHLHGLPELRRARRNLKSAIIEKSGSAAEEQRRIAAILEEAAARIRGAPAKDGEQHKDGERHDG